MDDDPPKSVGSVFTASLPAAISAGLFAIGALLVSLQIQSARIEATIQQMAQTFEEMKTESRSNWARLDERVRALEMRN